MEICTEFMGTILNLQFELENELSDLCNDDEKCSAVKEYLEKLDSNPCHSSMEEFGLDLQWLNVERPLSLEKDLSGKLVVLDFFTYCCINCMHVIPTLHRLEERFPPSSGLVVVGVHSAKFDNERLLSSVADAVLRNEITHPVVNDPQALLWKMFQVQCWPTLVILGPDGKVLMRFLGEGHEEELFRFCQVALEYFSSHNRLSPSLLPSSPLRDKRTSSNLLFPGKICCDPEGKRLFVADTGHHRILVLSIQGLVQDVIGEKESGFQDGPFESARFHSPQGVVYHLENDVLFVADTENHAIRKVDLFSKIVHTICGTGIQGADKEGGKMGRRQALSSPWDLCLAPAVGHVNGNVDTLYIAMAGLHQVWALFLKDTDFHKIGSVKAGTCMAVAGSGSEENRNNRYAMKAGFAQPSGIVAVDCDGQRLLVVADSESSSIRSVSLQDGSVSGLVGGVRDPMNLFAFGDQDGVGLDVKLQHPLGVAWSSSQKLLYLADSYNHKIKNIDPSTKECRTYAGTGQIGNRVRESLRTSDFNEPGGLALTPSDLYIADTNNHCIKTIDLETNALRELPIIFVASTQAFDSTDDGLAIDNPHKEISPVTVAPGGTITFLLTLALGKDFHLNEEAPQSWSLNIQGNELLKITGSQKGKLDSRKEHHQIVMHVDDDNPVDVSSDVHLLVRLYLCEKEVCFSKESLWTINVSVSHSATKEVETLLFWKVER